MKAPKLSQKDYEKMLEKLEKEGRIGFETLGHAALALLGAAAGFGAAGAVAAAAGANAIPILGGVAGALGLVVAAPTPVGWLVGSVAAGGAIFYGCGWVVRHGAHNAERLRRAKVDIMQKIEEMKRKEARSTETEQFKDVIHVLRTAHYQGIIGMEDGCKLVNDLKNNTISTAQALDFMEKLARSAPRNEARARR